VINDNLEIDTFFITCAEYQLFINEQQKVGENRQPFHWKTNRFPPGSAKLPITGIRASDAEAFCEWLTQQHSVLGFKYRLPTLDEASSYPASEMQIGCWVSVGKNKVLAGIGNSQWQMWQRSLADVLDRSCLLDFVSSLIFALDRVSAFDIDLTLVLDRAHFLSLQQARNHALVRARDHALARVRNISRNLALQLAKELSMALKLAQKFQHELIFDSDIALNQTRNLALNLEQNLVCESDLVIDLDLVRDLDRTHEGNLVNNFDQAHDLALSRDKALRCARDLSHIIGRDLARHLICDLVRVCDLDHAMRHTLYLNLDLVQELDRDLDYALDLLRTLNISFIRDLEQVVKCARYFTHDLNYTSIRYYLLLVAGCWYWLSQIYYKIQNNSQSKKVSNKYYELSQDYVSKKDKILNLYASFVLLEQRQSGTIPAWEGIRLVRERING